MNILFVNSTNQWAGIKTWMAHLGLFLHQRSHNVRFICRNADALMNFANNSRYHVHRSALGLAITLQYRAYFNYEER